ncbi:cobalamin-dependent methionine synthase I [Desulfocapsa sulfexigens DSM 10523]|uniref:Methionine synthase n=1 Tax=Desulfocapsa sulfexigens (strain DSM 10523 / SB164P1) TaxID=1167006 RepID=M1PSJ6_DESSD|nr:homocysteine S-methyltransferase family protein [Desulfocapsa sulfexigens]AGF79311.1 cobalamin-dependent methionine synthase I [Desulfocapsa sulfexigens DSM 10523]
MTFSEEPLLIFDGACGTTLQTMEIDAKAWDGLEGCNEYLNISDPDTIVELHRKFLQAGAMVIETNTFGSSSVVLSEYGLENRVQEINRAAVANAKRAIAEFSTPEHPRYIVGSVGPTTKLPILGHISPEALTATVTEQVVTLLDCGVDALIVETCQDLLQIKTSLIACFDLLEKTGVDLPVLASVTFEQQGTMLVGTDIGAVCATIAPFPVFSLGLNCATGPTDMEPHIDYLCKNWKERISCIPNQGMPEVVNGKTHYPLTPEEFGKHMYDFVTKKGVSIVGGCCGTSPAHIKGLVKALQGAVPADRSEVLR